MNGRLPPIEPFMIDFEAKLERELFLNSTQNTSKTTYTSSTSFSGWNVQVRTINFVTYNIIVFGFVFFLTSYLILFEYFSGHHHRKIKIKC
jgi:hypothetical protein